MRNELDDPVLWVIARIVHRPDLEDDRYDARYEFSTRADLFGRESA